MPILNARAAVRCDDCHLTYDVELDLSEGPWGTLEDAALAAARDVGFVAIGTVAPIRCRACAQRTPRSGPHEVLPPISTP